MSVYSFYCPTKDFEMSSMFVEHCKENKMISPVENQDCNNSRLQLEQHWSYYLH